MSSSKLIINSPEQVKQNQLNSIINGYPMTNTPVVPDIIWSRHQVEFKTIDDLSSFKFSLAKEGSDLVQPESLELTRQKILNIYRCDAAKKLFEGPLPTNLIAVSISMFNFYIGDSCHDFKLRNKESVDSYYTYRKMSECLQCCYYNEGGKQFQAGITFYPAPHGTPNFIESNRQLLFSATASTIPYPLCDRTTWDGFVKHKYYGRFCATAGRYLLVKLASRDGVPYHNVYDHVNETWKYEVCEECKEDFYTYKWEETKKDLPAAEVASASTQKAPVASVSEPTSTATLQDAKDAITDHASTTVASAVTRASSTESLLDGFEMIDLKCSGDDDESDIDAELIE